MELWKPIEGYEQYLISTKGRIFSIKSSIILKQQLDKDGYNIICLKGKTMKVHRLVGKAFISNFKNLPQINHKDGNKTNNKIENLEWCDASYNMQHSFNVLNRVVWSKGKRMSQEFKDKLSNLFKGKRSLSNNPRARKVICVETGDVYSCARLAEITLSISKGTVAHCAKGYTKTAGGYHWEYVD